MDIKEKDQLFIIKVKVPRNKTPVYIMSNRFNLKAFNDFSFNNVIYLSMSSIITSFLHLVPCGSVKSDNTTWDSLFDYIFHVVHSCNYEIIMQYTII